MVLLIPINYYQPFLKFGSFIAKRNAFKPVLAMLLQHTMQEVLKRDMEQTGAQVLSQQSMSRGTLLKKYVDLFSGTRLWRERGA